MGLWISDAKNLNDEAILCRNTVSSNEFQITFITTFEGKITHHPPGS